MWQSDVGWGEMTGRRRAGLVAARKAAGYTQERLAEATGVQRETVVRWEEGRHAPSPHLRPKLARILGRTVREIEDLIDLHITRAASTETSVTPSIEAACAWLDSHADWRSGTAHRRLISMLDGSATSRIRTRDGYRDTVGRTKITMALDRYYADGVPWYRANYGDASIQLAITADPNWLELGFPLTRETDAFTLTSSSPEDFLPLDSAASSQAIRRLLEAAALDVTIVNSPLYRLAELRIERDRITGSVSVIPFVQYALTTDLLETELVDQLVEPAVRSNPSTEELMMRDRYLPTISSIYDVPRRQCAGGVLALCAIARPADRYRGPADFVLLIQERGRRVLNGVGRISVIPRGFHQPLTDFRADASIGATLRRELEEELFHRTDVDNTISEQRIAEPMHPNRLSEPMRWLMQDPGRVRFESTGFGFNLVNGNFEYSCLILIDDPEFWIRYGDQIEANWEAVGLRQYSTLDRRGIHELIQDEAWSSEGLFAFLQGLKRLNQIGDERIRLDGISVDIAT